MNEGMEPEKLKALVHYRLEEAFMALDDAQGLMGLGRSSIGIVNRSYYAMYYAALAILQTTGQTPGSHAGVISLFNQGFVLPGQFSRDFGRDFHDVFDLRLRLDYRIITLPDSAKAKETYQKAFRFVDAIKKYLSDKGWV